ncbi:hypothetical protein [Actinoplanes sp. NPDC089786]|uniref:hypothetical protein n=1 Tax=Actinoplanes sp. NPDC089786 TaxID=3155185 RepID=UPI003445375A
MASFDQVVASFWRPDIEYLRPPPLTNDLVALTRLHLETRPSGPKSSPSAQD